MAMNEEMYTKLGARLEWHEDVDDPVKPDERVKVVITRASVRGHRCPLCGSSMGHHGPDYFVAIWERGPICDRCAQQVMPDYYNMLRLWKESQRLNGAACAPPPITGFKN